MISSHFCHRHQRLLVHVEDVGKAGEEPGEEQGGHASDEHIAVFLSMNETCKQCLTMFDDDIVQCLVSFAHLRLRSVRANVLPSVVDHLIEVEHLVVVVAVGGGVHLQC